MIDREESARRVYWHALQLTVQIICCAILVRGSRHVMCVMYHNQCTLELKQQTNWRLHSPTALKPMIAIFLDLAGGIANEVC